VDEFVDSSAALKDFDSLFVSVEKLVNLLKSQIIEQWIPKEK